MSNVDAWARWHAQQHHAEMIKQTPQLTKKAASTPGRKRRPRSVTCGKAKFERARHSEKAVACRRQDKEGGNTDKAIHEPGGGRGRGALHSLLLCWGAGLFRRVSIRTQRDEDG